MTEQIFENATCKCIYYDEIVDHRVELELTKPFDQMQMDERNAVLIAQYECGLFIKRKGYKTFVTSFDYNSATVTLSCFLK
jgi:hypothetical protein